MIESMYWKQKKLLSRPDILQRFHNGTIWPPHVVLHATSNCQLKCKHCTYANRRIGMEIPFDKLKRLLEICRRHGTRAIEHSGGEPMVYGDIKPLVMLINRLGFDQGLLTNGLLLEKNLGQEGMKACTWIRVSLDAFTLGMDVPDISFPPGPLVTASYVWNEGSEYKHFKEVRGWCKRHEVECRIVPDAFLPIYSPVREHMWDVYKAESDLEWVAIVDRDAHRRPPISCLTAWLKPMVAWDTYVYACCYGTTKEWGKQLKPEYRVCHMDEFETFFTSQSPMDLGHRCSNCLGYDQNNILAAVLSHVPHGNFF